MTSSKFILSHCGNAKLSFMLPKERIQKNSCNFNPNLQENFYKLCHLVFFNSTKIEVADESEIEKCTKVRSQLKQWLK